MNCETGLEEMLRTYPPDSFLVHTRTEWSQTFTASSKLCLVPGFMPRWDPDLWWL